MTMPEPVVSATTADSSFFVPDLCAGNAVLVLILVSELFVVTMVLAATGVTGFSWDYLAMVSLLVQWITLSSAYVLCKSRELLTRLSLFQSVAAIYLIILGLTALLTVLAQWILAGAAWSHWPTLDAPGMLRNLLVSAIMTGMVLRYMYLQSQLRRQEQAELTARIQALQARIRPHFLFNSMNSIASLIHSAPDTAEQVVEDLSDLFRASLGSDDLIPLAQEMTLCRQYVSIEQLRLGERLQVEWSTEGDDAAATIPQLTLQPLLENAIYHGVQPLPEGGVIKVAVKISDTVAITVTNPYRPQPSPPRQTGNHIALDNIRSRILAHYGKQAELDTHSVDELFVVRLSYPINTND